MRIGIDVRLYNESGVGRYIRNLIDQLQKLDEENLYFIFLLEKDFKSLSLKKNFTKVLANFKWYGLTEQIKFPRLLNEYNLDLVHFPHFNVPIFYKRKFVVTIHDLIHQHFQMRRATTHDPFTYWVKNLSYKKVFKNAVKKSQKIITVSNFVKDSLKKEWDVNEEKVEVTHEAVDNGILKIEKNTSKNKIQKILEKFSIRPPFIFYVGNAHPHKNVEGLIRAFLELRKKYQYLQLVLSGNDHYFWQRIKKEYSGIAASQGAPRNDVVFTGYISDEELVALYKSAQVFVLPSFEEGFGIPILEAYALGCPVICSNAGSLPEVGSDAAIYFNPKNQSNMIEKIMEVLNNQKLRQQLIEKGQKRYTQFSWEELAKKTQEIYKST